MLIFGQYFRCALRGVFLFMVLIISLVSSVNAASPVVQNSIPNQVAHNGNLFDMSFDTYDVFNDVDGDTLNVTVKQVGDFALPAWLTSEAKPITSSLIGGYYELGYANKVAIVGNYAYIANDYAGLQIIDISTPSSPSLVGTYNTSGRAQEVVVVGDYAYVADDQVSGLQIIDISIPSSPSLVGTYNTSGFAWGVTVVGNYAYVADFSAGLQIIDISVPSSPSLVGTYDTLGAAVGVSVVGNYAYVADGSAGLQIIDISVPNSPSLVGTYNTSGFARGVTVVGNLAYVADGGEGLQIIDISVPGSPSLVGTYDTLGAAIGVSVVGNYAYVADFDKGLAVIDISVPSSPSLAGIRNTPGSAYGVAVVGNYAYVADFDKGLAVIDISTPSIPSLVKQYDTSGRAWRVTVVGNLAYVANGVAGLQIIDISVPGSPSLVGTYSVGYARGIAVVGNYAYVADSDAGLQIIDISVPSSPSLAGTCNTPGSAYGVAVVGNYAYVADGDAGLQIIDISVPSSPSLAGTCNTPGSAYGVAVVGNYAYVAAYVADFSAGLLQIIDISVPSSPSLVGTYNTPGFAIGVSVVGNLAYVADGGEGLQIIDISVPGSPSLVGTYYTSSVAAVEVAIVGNYAYVANSDTGLRIIDVSVPSSPSLAGTCNTPGSAYGVAVVGNYAYVADYITGLQIIRGVGEGVQLSGTPTIFDMGMLNLKATASDGVNEVSTTFSIDVQNTAPVISVVPKTGTEDAVLTFTEADFTNQFSDANGNSLTKIQVVSLPTNGTLKLSGATVELNQEIIGASLGNVTFEPNTNWNGNTSFSWKGHDGVEYSALPANVNINILAVNDIPVVTNVPKLGTEDTVLAFSAADFTDHFSDVDGESLTKIQITSLPSSSTGVLKFSGASVTLNQEIDVGDLSNLTFEPNSNWNGNTSFSWKGHDGIEYSASPADVNINMAAVQDAPTITNVPKSGTEDTILAFSAADFTGHFSDVDGESLTKIQITNLPTNGTLKLSGTPVILNQEIVVGSLGNLTFEPNTNWNGNTSFSWKGHDGVEYSALPADVNINILAVNDNPTIGSIVVSGMKNTALTFYEEEFAEAFEDIDGHNMMQIKILSLPSNGQLKLLNSGVVTEDQEITANDIKNLVFDPDKDWVGTTNFGWLGFDGMNYSNDEVVTININERTSWYETWWGGLTIAGVGTGVATVVTTCAVTGVTYLMCKYRGLYRKTMDVGGVELDVIEPSIQQNMNIDKKSSVPAIEDMVY